jgi:DNA-binding NarL/FixJ family response regulator
MRDEASSSRQIRIVVYTDQPLLAAGACALLSSTGSFEVVLAETDLLHLPAVVRSAQPGIILVDLTPDVTLDIIGSLRAAVPVAHLVLWGRTFSEQLVAQCRELGVAGYIHRAIPNERFLSSLYAVAGGGEACEQTNPERCRKVDLTPRESQLVALLTQGLRNKQIATWLGITEGTVRVYLSRLFVKCGARDRLELALFGLQNGFYGQATWDRGNVLAADNDAGRTRPALRSLHLIKSSAREEYAGLAKAAAQ